MEEKQPVVEAVVRISMVGVGVSVPVSTPSPCSFRAGEKSIAQALELHLSRR